MSDSHDDSVSRSIVLARQTFTKQAPLVLRPREQATLCLLVLDASGSMQVHGDAPRLAVNELIQTVRGTPGADRTMLGVIPFNHEVSLAIPPTRATDALDLATYVADGGTALFAAANAALEIGLEFRGRAKIGHDADLAVAISVLSDGQDTCSGHMHETLLENAKAARDFGFKLQAIGIGIDAPALAWLLGFVERSATPDPRVHVTVAGTSTGVREASRTTTLHFSKTMRGSAWSPSPTSGKADHDTDRDPLSRDSTYTPV